MQSMKNKVAIVTGAGSGIGRATAYLFATNGAAVVASDVNMPGAEETVRTIKKCGGEAIAVHCDIAKSNDVATLISTTIQTFGKLDYACNNAGIEGQLASTIDCTEENARRVIDTNLLGTWLCMKYEIPEMMKANGASGAAGDGHAIVNIASIAGLIGFPGLPLYVASKHGINGLTKTAALEYAPHNIRINAVCPGAIQTPMIDRVIHDDQHTKDDLLAHHPMGRFGTPEEIAELVVWLCSDAASFVTGQTIAADGGYVAQ